MPSSYRHTFFMSYFFFYSYGHHRDLHSFPTRRSSDLIWHSPISRCASYWRPAFISATTRGAGTRNERDRKSTRLNSSHTVISYAVFCLKKKKKRGQTPSSPQRKCRRSERTLVPGPQMH